LNDGDKVNVISPRGKIETKCIITEDVPEGVAYLAINFFPFFVNNLLTYGEDSIGFHPEYKSFVGRVEKC